MKPTKPGYFDREECRPFYHRGGDNGILLVHGFTGSAAHMRPLADELARRGRTVRTINLPGHAPDRGGPWAARTGRAGFRPSSRRAWR